MQKFIGINDQTGEYVVLSGKNILVRNGYDFSHVYKCVRGERKTHKGFRWIKEARS